MGDFNSEPTESHMEDFCYHSMSHLIKEPTCYKSLGNPTCIDLILTNFPKSFQTPRLSKRVYLISIK